MQIHAVVKRHENIKSDHIRKRQIRKKNEQTDANLISVEQIVANDLFKKKYMFLINII